MHLPGSLHANVPLRTDVTSRAKHGSQMLGQRRNILNRSVSGCMFNDLLNLALLVDAVAQRGREDRIHFDELLPAEDLPGEGERKQRLNARRALSNDRNRPGGGDGRHVGVPHAPAAVFSAPNAAFPGGEGPTCFSKTLTGCPAGFADSGANTVCHLQSLLRVVGDCQLEQQVGKTHHPQTDLPRGVGCLVDLWSGILVYVDDVVEKAYGQFDCPLNAVPVDSFDGRAV